MNKKIIAVAVATIMAAPVAMADVKTSGRMGGNFTFVPKEATATAAGDLDATKSSRRFNDAGAASRIVFDGTVGNAYARIAYKDNTKDRTDRRDTYLGYNLGNGSSIQFNRMGTAGKDSEKDPYITTFLQVRATAALVGTDNKYVSNGFVNGLAQYKTKVGGNTLVVQYDPTDNYGTGNPGHIAVAASGKSGAIRYWASYNTGTANTGTGNASTGQTNGKVGASMKMGNMKATLLVTHADLGNGGNKTTATTAWVDFGLGGGLSANVGYGGNGDTGTWLRAAVNKKLNKGANVYAGLVNTKAAASGSKSVNVFGAGMIVKF